MTSTELKNWLLCSPNWMWIRLKDSGFCKDEIKLPENFVQQKIISDPKINLLLDGILNYPLPVLKRHNDSSHWIHLLSFLADMGLVYTDDPRITFVIDGILKNFSDDGFPQVLINISTHFGGTGEDQLTWFLCDAPLIMYSLIKMKAPGAVDLFYPMIEKINNTIEDVGIPCSGSIKNGSFRGPGKKSDPCPYANLLYLKLVNLSPETLKNPLVKIVQQSLLDLWENRLDKKQYLFAMGSGFEKLKAPLIWFDILHVVEVLSHYPELRTDERFKTMASLLLSKKNKDGHYQAESIWKPWKDWDFGQKKEPSYWITFLISEIEERINF